MQLFLYTINTLDSDRPTCNKELLRTFGLEGFEGENPKVQLMEMCPHLTLTCCTKNDQLILYQNWIVGQEY